FDQITKNVAQKNTDEYQYIDSDTYDTKGYFMSDDVVAFKVWTKNTGGKPGSVTLEDTIPTGLTYVKTVNVTPEVTPSVSGNKVTLTWSSVPAGGEVSAIIVCKVDEVKADASLKNTVKNSDGYSADAYVPVKASNPSIAVTKTASTNSILANTANSISYRIVVSNNGTDQLTGVYLKDALSGENASFEGTANITSGKWTQYGANGTPKISNDSLAVGESITSTLTLLDGQTLEVGEYIVVDLVVDTTAAKAGAFYNTAYVGSDQTTPEKISSVKINVSDAAANVTSSKNGYFLVDGQQMNSYQIGKTTNEIKAVYYITVSNTGTADAKNITVADTMAAKDGAVVTLPDGVTGSNGNWTIASLGVGKSVQIKIEVKFTDEQLKSYQESGKLTNTATVTYDGKTSNPKTELQVKPGSVDIAFHKTAIKTSYIANQGTDTEQLFKITATNNGTIAAENFVITDTFGSAWYDGVTYSIDKGAAKTPTITDNAFTIEVGTLGAGKTVEIIISGKIKSGQTGALKNSATYG
ncbi:MAG: hypothetical protein IJY74_02100, partial [Oscillospiraceae bacterium]|nr:hypothetical protein [Oscillospiraceae bacterium]